MKSITIITLLNVRNYGSVLQTFATQMVFQELGLKVDFFNYYKPNELTLFMRMKRWTRGLNLFKRIAYSFLLFPSFIKQNVIFKRFLSQNVNVQSKKVSSDKDFEKLIFSSDIYCTGSDQTWNSGWNDGICSPLFLDFIKDKKKISYAASFGKENLDDWEKEIIARKLKSYDMISVRESSAVNIINGLGIQGSILVLDPTLQKNRNFWRQYAHSFYNKPYVLIYQLNSNSRFDNYAKEYAKKKGCLLIRLCTRYDQVLKCGKSVLIPDVFDFVSLIMYADTVITDSFHATAFSINCNTSFISIYPNDFSSRLDSILKLTHLENRHLQSYSDFSFTAVNSNIWKSVNLILDEKRRDSRAFLEKAVVL